MAGYLPTATLGVPAGSYGNWNTVDGTPQWTGSFGPPKSGSSNGVNTGSVNPFASLLTNAMSGLGSTNNNANPTAQVKTSINPANVYSPTDTQHAVNQAMAQGQMQADPYSAIKQFDRAGVSRSAGTLARALPSMAQGQTAAAFAPGQIGLSDATTNAQNMLAGQTGRDAEGLGLAGILAKQNNLANVQNLATLSPLLSYLSQSAIF